MKLLTNEHQELNENAKICYNSKKQIEDKYVRGKKNIVDLGIIVIIQGNIEALHLAYVI